MSVYPPFTFRRHPVKKTLLLFSAIGLGALLSPPSHAASVNEIVVLNGAPATAVSCAPNPLPTFTAPLAAGTVLCSITVTPSTWSGTIALSGSNATAFTLLQPSPGVYNLAVGSPGLATPGSYNVIVTASP
jgi:hypothetical protein